jgi:hypothetical protein
MNRRVALICTLEISVSNRARRAIGKGKMDSRKSLWFTKAVGVFDKINDRYSGCPKKLNINRFCVNLRE